MKEAIILAGGFGTRLRQVVPDLPKPMAPVAGRPFLEILLDYLLMSGFKRVILSLGYRADIIQSYFGNRYKTMELVYVVEDAPLGTGGAVRLAMEQCTADHVFIFNGDTFLEFDVNGVEKLWQQYRTPIMLAKEVSDTSRYGRLLTKDNQVIGFSEKGVSGAGLINAGCYLLPAGVLNDYPIGTGFSLETDYFSLYVQQQPILYHATPGRFIDIGVPDDYARAQEELADL